MGNITDSTPMTSAARNALLIRRERMWVTEDSRKQLLGHLDGLMASGRRRRKRSIAIVSESNGGKTALAQRFLRNNPPRDTPDGRIIPAIYVSMTTIPRVGDLSRALLRAIDAPAPDAGTHEMRLQRFIDLAKAVQLGIVFLDEFHDCADTTGRGTPFLRCIKGLMNAGIIVVPIGVQELSAVLARDSQLSSRFNFTRGRLARIREPEVALALIQQMLEPGTPLPGDDCVLYVLRETRGVLGHFLDLVEDTLALHGSITLENLRRVRSEMDVLDGLT